MFVSTGGTKLLGLLMSVLYGNSWFCTTMPGHGTVPFEALERWVDSAFESQLQVSPPRSISQTPIRVPTTGATGSPTTMRDSRPLFGSNTASAAQAYNRQPRAPSPPPLVTSREVASGVVRRSVFGNYWGW